MKITTKPDMNLGRSLSAPKRHLRRLINTVLQPLGQELVPQRLAYMPHRQLQLTCERFGIDLIVDVGANTGQFGRELFAHSFRGKVVSIEPLSEPHSQLSKAARRNPNWKVLDPVAAGSDERTVEIQVAGNSMSSSILKMLDRHVQAAPESAIVRHETVQQRTLDALVLDELKDRSGTLIKIDTQGYEHQVLQGASGCLEQAKLVLLELSLQPLYAGQMLWLDLIEYMQARGFEVWAIQPEFCDPESGQVLQVNGVFSRAERPR